MSGDWWNQEPIGDWWLTKPADDWYLKAGADVDGPISGGEGGGGSSVDPDAAAFIARMSVAPSTEQASIYDSFVKSAKSIGVWDYITDCGFLCAHTDQASKLGVKDVINLTNVGAGPTHYPGWGVRGNGTSTALDTGYKFPSGQQNDASLGIYCAEEFSANDTGDIGNDNSLIACGLGTSSVSSYASRVNAASSSVVSQTDTMGFYCVSRGTVETCYKRGARSTTAITVSATPDATYNIRVCGVNRATPLWSSRMLSYWHIGTAIPDEIQLAYSDLVEITVSRLAASHTVVESPTPETRAMYRYFIAQTRRQNYLVGNFDNRYWPLDTSGRVMVEEFETITGEVAAVISHEWVDPLRDPTESAAQLARIKAQYAAGNLISLHNHPGNPVTGLGLHQAPDADTENVGNQYDRGGAPVVAILSGGSERQQFLDYVDRIIAFLNLCVTDSGQKIPIMLRWWHEIDQRGFWWSDTVAANTVQLWQDFVDRIKAAGVNHVLFDFARDFQVVNMSVDWWPGDEYVDIHSGSSYENDTATPTGQSTRTDEMADMLVSSRRKPRWFGELGYNPASETVMDLWDVKTAYVIRDTFPDLAGFLLWRAPWGPKVGNVNNQSLINAIDEPSAIVLSRLSNAYTLPSPSAISNWWFNDAIIDLDLENDRCRYNGVNYSSFAALVTAGFASEVGGIKRVSLGALLPAAYSIVARGVTSASATGGTGQYILTLDDGDDGTPLDEAVILTRQVISSQDRLAASMWHSSVSYPNDGSVATTGAVSNSTPALFAVRCKAGDFGGSFQKQTTTKTVTAQMPTLTQLVVGNREDGARPWGGTVSRIAILNTELSDAQLAAFW